MSGNSDANWPLSTKNRWLYCHRVSKLHPPIDNRLFKFLSCLRFYLAYQLLPRKIQIQLIIMQLIFLGMRYWAVSFEIRVPFQINIWILKNYHIQVVAIQLYLYQSCWEWRRSMLKKITSAFSFPLYLRWTETTLPASIGL